MTMPSMLQRCCCTLLLLAPGALLAEGGEREAPRFAIAASARIEPPSSADRFRVAAEARRDRTIKPTDDRFVLTSTAGSCDAEPAGRIFADSFESP
jgi:hypothetical protein